MTATLTGLLEEARQLGFLGPGPVEAHLVRAAAFAAAVPDPPARALDLGAGGGLPGLVLAGDHWPGARGASSTRRASGPRSSRRRSSASSWATGSPS